MNVTAGVLSHPQAWFALGRWLAPGLTVLDEPTAEMFPAPPESPPSTSRSPKLPVWLL